MGQICDFSTYLMAKMPLGICAFYFGRAVSVLWSLESCNLALWQDVGL